MVGRECDIVASLDLLARGKSDRVSLDDLLGEGLRCRGGWCIQGGEDVGGRGVF